MRTVVLKLLSPSIHENIKPLQLFKPSLISVAVFYSSQHKDIVCLVLNFMCLIFDAIEMEFLQFYFVSYCYVEIELILASRSSSTIC